LKNITTFWGLNNASVEKIYRTSFDDLFEIDISAKIEFDEMCMNTDTHQCPVCNHLLRIPSADFFHLNSGLEFDLGQGLRRKAL
jgi:hypothetical protein